MKKLLYILPLASFLLALKPASQPISAQDAVVIEETFFTLDSVWTPGVRNKYPLFPHDNYLLLKDGMATLILEEARGESFRGQMNDIEIKEVDGKRVTTFAVRNAKMRVELREVDGNKFEIYVYKYLGSYERMFVATWVDLSKVNITFED